MRKLFTVMAALLVTAMVAGPALAAVQNVRVSGSIDNTFLHRKNFDFGLSDGDLEQNVFFTQTILQVDADLTDQVAATIALINERPWNQDADNPSGASEVAIYQAYVTLREMLYSPLTLVIGRQNFAYGNSLIVDSAGTNNTAPGDSGLNNIAEDLTKMTAMDAVRAILDYNPLTVDIVYSQIEETTSGWIHDRDHVLAGINANYQLGDEMDSVIEAYFWKKADKSITNRSYTDEVYTVGGRVSTNPIEGLNLQVENAYQKGTKVRENPAGGDDAADVDFKERRDAWIVQAIANYQLPVMDEYNPTLQYVYTKATGDENETSADTEEYTGWDPMFENQGGGKIYNALYNLTNFEIHQLTLGFNPMEDLLAKLSLSGIWLEREVNSNLDGAVESVQPQGGTTSFGAGDQKIENTWLGKEIDLELIYDYTEDVQIAGNFGWFFPGSFYRSPNDETAKQAIVNVNVAF